MVASRDGFTSCATLAGLPTLLSSLRRSVVNDDGMSATADRRLIRMALAAAAANGLPPDSKPVLLRLLHRCLEADTTAAAFLWPSRR